MQGCYDPILQWFHIAICPMKAHNMYFTNKLWLLRKQNGCQGGFFYKYIFVGGARQHLTLHPPKYILIVCLNRMFDGNDCLVCVSIMTLQK